MKKKGKDDPKDKPCRGKHFGFNALGETDMGVSKREGNIDPMENRRQRSLGYLWSEIGAGNRREEVAEMRR